MLRTVKNNIDAKVNLIVFGYIRLNLFRQFYYNIPFEIKNVIIAFYKPSKPNSFKEMKLRPSLIQAIEENGWKIPSYIQQEHITPLIDGFDMFITGLGEQASSTVFTIAALQKLELNETYCQILIAIPHSEPNYDASYKTLKKLSKYMDITMSSMYLPYGRNEIKSQIIVANTWGICTALDRYLLDVSKLKMFVFSCLDQHISYYNTERIYQMMKHLSPTTQILIFTSHEITNDTASNFDIQHFCQQFLSQNVLYVCVAREKLELTLDGIKQYYIAVEKEDYKLATLYDLYESLTIFQAIIFVNTRQKVIWLKNKMTEYDFTVSAIYDNMYPKDIQLVMDEFKNGGTRILISTDLLSKEVDIPCIKLVINYDLPMNRESYMHRGVRYGTYDRVVISFVMDEEEAQLRNIETFYNIVIEELPNEVDSILG